MRNLKSALSREWNRLFSTRLTKWGLFLLPILSVLLFFSIYYNAFVLKIPTVIVDKDKSASSRQIVRYLSINRYLSVDYKMDSFEKALPLVKSQKAYILIYIPSKFEKNLLIYNQPTIKAFSYGTNLLIGRLAQKSVVECISALNKERSRLNIYNLRQESAYTKNTGTQPELMINNVYNPSYNYLWYMSPAVTMSLWQMILLIICIPLFSKEWEKDKYSALLQSTGKNTLTVYLSKLLIPLAFMLMNFMILYYLVFPLSNLAILGNFFTGLLIFSLFFISIMNLAFFIANLVKQSLFCTEIGIFITAPAFAFSGYTYPFLEMPLLHRIFALSMPTTHFLPVFSMFYMQGSDFSLILLKMKNLILYTLITSALALYFISKNIRNAK